MIEMRQPFFSIANSAIFMVLGVFFGSLGTTGEAVSLGYLSMPSQALWAATGLMFIMAYFSLVHLKTEKKK